VRLSDVAPRLDLVVLRDAEFNNLGFLFDDLSAKLVFVEDPRFVEPALQTRGLQCVVCLPELAAAFSEVAGVATSAAPRTTFFELQQLLEQTDFYWTPFPTQIDPSASIHPRAWIADQNVRIGPGTIVEANAVVGERSIIGAGVRVRAGTVIGSEAFQPGRYSDRIVHLPHAGGVLVRDHVQIFANAVVARAVFRQMTTLGEYSQIGNGAFVSHNVQVGKRCFIGHNSTVNGNTSIDDDAWIGPNSTISNLLHIGRGAQVSLGAVVIRSVPPGARVTGMTAMEHRRMLRHMASIFPRHPE
jgi:UDP-3-O-[3-hydroxymyristoyl] glucosamine N-acyltransferase